MTETWRPIPSLVGYEASSEGRIRSLKRKTAHIKALRRNKAGYLCFDAWNGTPTTCGVHVVVAEAFHGPRPVGCVVRHLDGDQLNNRAANLAWGSQRENMRDVVRHGHHRGALQTHCKNGHPFDEQNTYRRGRRRLCRACNRQAAARLAARKRAALVGAA